jgi:predicted metalloprotease with PDZ domain
MVTAFLCDVLLLHNSKGKRSVNDIFREFYAKHKHPNPRTDGHKAAVALLQQNTELTPVIHRYVNGPDKFAWEPELSLAGLELKNGLTVMPRLSGKQKDLLDALGYNNWRKLSKQK